MICKNCNKPLPENARFCGNCGTPVTAPPADRPAPFAPPSPAMAGRQPQTPAAPPTTKSRRPLIIGIICLVILIAGLALVGGSIARNLHKTDDGKARSKVNTDCFAFTAPKGLSVNGSEHSCRASVSKAREGTFINVGLMVPTVNENTLAKLAEQHFLHDGGKAGQTATKVKFAGKTAMKYTYKTETGNNAAHLYIYDADSKVTGNGSVYKGLVISLQTRQDADALINSLADTWLWKADQTAAKLEGSLPLAAAKTDCYSFVAPSDAEGEGDTAACSLVLNYGQAGQSRLNVWSNVGKKGSLQAMVESWKKPKSNRTQIISETPVTIGGLPAVKLVYHTSSKSSRDKVTYLVYDGGQHTKSNTVSDGFEITGGYDATNGEQKATDAMIASWKWL